MERKTAVIAGHICLDVTPVFAGKKEARVEEVLIPGKLVHTDGIDIHTGGAVANTGLAMKKLGVDVRLLGKIGEDEFGALVMKILGEQGYERTADMILAGGNATSYSIVLAVPGVDRIFLHDPGANDTFRAADIDFDAVGKAALFHFGYPPIMRQMYANDGEELVEVFRRAKEQGMATSLDMAAVDEKSEAGAVDWRRVLKRVLPLVDFFVPSVEELCFMLDKERYAAWQKRDGGDDRMQALDWKQDVAPLADELLSMGAKVVLIKCGAPGMYYRSASAETLAGISGRVALETADWAEREGFEASFVPERVLSATGAGDTSIAAFLTAMLAGKPFERCVTLAAAEGACCVASYDALSGLKPLDELEAKIDSGWERQV